MEGRFNNPSLISETEDYENSPENSGDSLPSGMFNEGKIASTSFPKRSRRAMEKRVVSVPITDMDGSRLKGEMGAPPSDSWAWRKYGQKPIKGSPYPRAYYRCSSSKGCPARKQVERSRVDPNMLVITYACEHNHPWPTSRNNHHHHHNLNHKHNSNDANTATDTVSTDSEANKAPAATILIQPEPEVPDHQRFENLGHEESLITPDHGFRSWFSDFECSSPTLLETPIFVEDRVSEADTTHFSMREEDELLFADLGELPECSTVFGRGVMEREEERRQCTFTPWCGTT